MVLPAAVIEKAAVERERLVVHLDAPAALLRRPSIASARPSTSPSPTARWSVSWSAEPDIPRIAQRDTDSRRPRRSC